MSNKYNNYALKMATHILVWLLLMVVPYVSTDQVFEVLEFKSDIKYFVHYLALSAVLIATFYVNYLLWNVILQGAFLSDSLRIPFEDR